VSSEYPLFLAMLTIGRSAEVMAAIRSGMSIAILLMLILTSVLMVLSSSKADAQTACETELTVLQGAIEDATFTNPQDQENLLIKLQKANDKLTAGKTEDAIAKIADIQSAAEKLAAGGKVEGGDAIVDAAEAAISCLGDTSSV
jgi:TolA-binding protein